MNISKFTRDTFRAHLENIYGCEFVGENVQTGWINNSDDCPDLFRPHDKNKDCFCVPLPTAPQGRYEQWMIDHVIEQNELTPITTAYTVANKN